MRINRCQIHINISCLVTWSNITEWSKFIWNIINFTSSKLLLLVNSIIKLFWWIYCIYCHIIIQPQPENTIGCCWDNYICTYIMLIEKDVITNLVALSLLNHIQDNAFLSVRYIAIHLSTTNLTDSILRLIIIVSVWFEVLFYVVSQSVSNDRPVYIRIFVRKRTSLH